MKRMFQFGIVIAMLLGMIGFAMPAYASTPQHYTVLVGAENTGADSIMDYFPHTVDST